MRHEICLEAFLQEPHEKESPERWQFEFRESWIGGRQGLHRFIHKEK